MGTLSDLTAEARVKKQAENEEAAKQHEKRRKEARDWAEKNLPDKLKTIANSLKNLAKTGKNEHVFYEYSSSEITGDVVLGVLKNGLPAVADKLGATIKITGPIAQANTEYSLSAEPIRAMFSCWQLKIEFKWD